MTPPILNSGSTEVFVFAEPSKIIDTNIDLKAKQEVLAGASRVELYVSRK